MAKPLPLPVWDHQRGKLVSEWMDDHKTTYESQPRRSITQWIKSQPLYERLYALYQNTHWSARQIEPFIRKYHIDMNEFEPVNYRSFSQFFDRRFRPRVRKFPSAPGEMGARGGAPDEHAHSDIEHVGLVGYASAIRVGRGKRVTGFPGPDVAHPPN